MLLTFFVTSGARFLMKGGTLRRSGLIWITEMSHMYFITDLR